MSAPRYERFAERVHEYADRTDTLDDVLWGWTGSLPPLPIAVGVPLINRPVILAYDSDTAVLIRASTLWRPIQTIWTGRRAEGSLVRHGLLHDRLTVGSRTIWITSPGRERFANSPD